MADITSASSGSNLPPSGAQGPAGAAGAGATKPDEDYPTTYADAQQAVLAAMKALQDDPTDKTLQDKLADAKSHLDNWNALQGIDWTSADVPSLQSALTAALASDTKLDIRLLVLILGKINIKTKQDKMNEYTDQLTALNDHLDEVNQATADLNNQQTANSKLDSPEDDSAGFMPSTEVQNDMEKYGNYTYNNLQSYSSPSSDGSLGAFTTALNGTATAIQAEIKSVTLKASQASNDYNSALDSFSAMMKSTTDTIKGASGNI